MGAITDDAPVEFGFVPDDELVGYTEDEAYAFLAGVGPETSTTKLPLVAAANDGHTGAMIALVPSDTDAKRIAVAGGEPIDQLHVTLAYLGEAASVPDDAQKQITRALNAAVEDAIRPDYDLPLHADGFAISVFNPGDTNDRETCLVLGLSGADLDAVHGIVTQTLDQVQSDLGSFTIPDQHAPWVPHLTLIYTNDLTSVRKLTDRVGPITFDKLRVAFADQVIDIPLKPIGDENPQPSATVTVAGGGDDVEPELSESELTFTAEYEEYLNALSELADEGLLEFTRERDVNLPVPGGHNLRDYWVRGEGAAKIRWNTKGDGTRCIHHLRKYVRDPGGLCQEYHRMATGTSMHPHPGHQTEAYGEEAMEFANNPDQPYGDVKYADPGYQADGRNRYPIDTPTHIRAAWSYINMPKNAAKYSSDQLKTIRDKIKKAMSGVGADVQAQVVVITAARRSKATPPAAIPDVGGCPPDHHQMPDGSCMPNDQMMMSTDQADVAAADEPWEGVLTVEGTESGDGRLFSLGSLDWAQLPLPLMYQPANVGGHTGSIIVGEITRAARRGNEIYGWGKVNGSALAGEHGDGIRTMMDTGGVSVDVDKVKDADVEMVYADGEEGGLMTKPDTTIFHRGRIRGATLVAYPAFVEAKLHFTNQVETASYDVDDEDCGCGDTLTASGTHTITIPDLPPKSWFEKPTDVKMYGALTITDEGRVFGRLAPSGVTHRNRPRRVPMGNVDYSRWMKGETIVEGSERIVTGVITGNCGHASEVNYGTLANRKEHYDNSCSVFANVRIGEDADGVWVAGALRHGVTGEQVATALGCSLSGDWQPHPDRPGVNEFIAALLVPVPGFPLARTQPSVAYNDGVVTAAAVPVRLGLPEPPSIEEQARQALRTAKAALLTRAGMDPYSRKREIMTKVGG